MHQSFWTSLRAGRLGRALFLWAVAAMVTAAGAAMWFDNETPFYDWPQPAQSLPLTLPCLWLLVSAFRLRDMGLSAWVAPAGTIIPPVAGLLGTYPVVNTLEWAGVEGMRPLIIASLLTVLVLGVVPLVGFFIWLAAAPSRPN